MKFEMLLGSGPVFIVQPVMRVSAREFPLRHKELWDEIRGVAKSGPEKPRTTMTPSLIHLVSYIDLGPEIMFNSSWC